MRTYRAQDSPLPGIPAMLGRKGRSASDSSVLARQQKAPAGSAIAWSGQRNDSPPLVKADSSSNARLASSPGLKADSSLAKVRALVQTGRDRLAKVGVYQVAMNRQERVGGSLLPAEDVLLSIRRNPKAVRLEWPAGSHKGREVIYDAAKPGGMMHINLADSIVPMPRMTLSPDSPLVMKNSRHPITEAGLDAILDQLALSLKAQEDGNATGEKLTYDGLVTPAETGRACHKVTRVTAKGVIWTMALDAETGVPALVQENSPEGDLLEKYVFRNFVADPPTLAEASAFDPDGRWGASKGLFGRMAQGLNPATPAVR